MPSTKLKPNTLMYLVSNSSMVSCIVSTRIESKAFNASIELSAIVCFYKPGS
jgi:hypothetical protein